MEFKEIQIKPREYQEKIFNTASKSNTLVVLPTGLGKTLIALMLSVERLKKFPGKKVLMLAPTRPLVEQHYNYYKKNLPELFADIELFTGELSSSKRKKIFQTAEIIFSTPQCIANDLENSLYDLKEVVLLIIDEAHRCLKNYDYTKVVKYYKEQAENQRILGLTASPGHESQKVKEICQHLNIDSIEVRTRESEDVKEYLQELEFNKIVVPFPPEFQEIKILLKKMYDEKIEQLKNRNLLFGPANKVTLLQLQSRLAAQYSPKNFNVMAGMGLTAQAIKLSHAMELLETQTLSGLNEYMQEIVSQAKNKKSRAVQTLAKSPEFNASLISLKELLAKKIEHPKIEECAVLIENELKKNEKAKFIVFTQFRETAVKLAERLNKIQGIKCSTFFGQAKKKDTGFSQKEQKEIINKLNSGEINAIIATSIGEEGLDIAEVSCVIFYEPIPSAIRKIQRAGRTARLAAGKLFILITKDTRDVAFHYASSAREKKMYKILDNVKKDIENEKKENLEKIQNWIEKKENPS